MRQSLHPAYVIHTRAFRDTSMIVELFTPEQGRMSVLARGAKAGKAQKSLLLQPFRSLHVAWAGRGELPVLSAIEEAGHSLRLQGQSLACGYYVNELIYHLLPRDDPAPALFASYWSVVSSLTESSQREQALRRFELELLVQIGYEPLLDHDYLSGEPVEGRRIYSYRVPEGPALVADFPVESGPVKDVSNLDGARDHLAQSGKVKPAGMQISGQSLLDLSQGQFDNPVSLKEARDLMRRLIHYQLDGRELLSRALFNSFRDLNSSVAND